MFYLNMQLVLLIFYEISCLNKKKFTPDFDLVLSDFLSTPHGTGVRQIVSVSILV